jgi:hypothetical protein
VLAFVGSKDSHCEVSNRNRRSMQCEECSQGFSEEESLLYTLIIIYVYDCITEITGNEEFT